MPVSSADLSREAAAPAAAAAAPLLHAPARPSLLGGRRASLAACAASLLALAALVIAGLSCQDAAQLADFTAKGIAPSPQHPFGTDMMGRDMLARTLAGLSTSVLVGLLAAGASSLIALALGTAAALGGPRVDAAVTWLIDLCMGIPHIVLLILISYALGKGFWGVAIGVALTHWPSLTRVIRAEVLQCKNAPYVAVARKLGAGPARIALTHVLPFVLPQYLVGLVLLFPHAILHEAAVTFLGFGLSPEQPICQITRAQRQTIGAMLKALPLHIDGMRPVEEAIVTRGGVQVQEIVPGTMMSKLSPGLFFAGEVLDVDAHTGGFNLQIAFSTGALAGRSAAAYI